MAETDSGRAALVAETDRILAELRDEAAGFSAITAGLAEAAADTIADEFAGHPGLGRVIVAAVAAVAGVWHAANPGHEEADTEDVIGLLGAVAAELERRDRDLVPLVMPDA